MPKRYRFSFFLYFLRVHVRASMALELVSIRVRVRHCCVVYAGLFREKYGRAMYECKSEKEVRKVKGK